MEEQIHIRVRTANRVQLSVAVLLSNKVSELKEVLATRTSVPPARQKLIYHGRVLKDEETLMECKIEPDHVLHMVAAESRPLPTVARSPPPSSVSHGLIQMEIRATLPLPRRRRRDEDEVPELVSPQERLEAIAQNLVSIEGLLGCRTDPKQGGITGFDFSKRRLHPGQWIDALDTTNQWLEAQVVQVQSLRDSSRVFIHYNGWPVHWDEWVCSKSLRLQLLGTRTSRIRGTAVPWPTHSPFPGTPPDAANTQLQLIDLDEVVKRSIKVFPVLRRLLEQYSELRGAMEPTGELDTLRMQLGMLLDRTGRLMSDVGRAVEKSEPSLSTMLTPAESVLLEDREQLINLSFVLQSRD